MLAYYLILLSEKKNAAKCPVIPFIRSNHIIDVQYGLSWNWYRCKGFSTFLPFGMSGFMKHLRKVNDTFGVILQMMNNMGGEDDLPDLDGADDVSFFHPFVCFLSISLACMQYWKLIMGFRLTNISPIIYPLVFFRMSLQIVMTRVSINEPIQQLQLQLYMMATPFDLWCLYWCKVLMLFPVWLHFQKCQIWSRKTVRLWKENGRTEGKKNQNKCISWNRRQWQTTVHMSQ